MKTRQTFAAIALAIAAVAGAAPAAFSGTFVGGEAGYLPDEPVTALSRAQVQTEYAAFRVHPMMMDGTVVVNGEAGNVPANQGALAYDAASGPHAQMMRAMGHGAAMHEPVAPGAGSQYRDLYPN